MILTAYRVQMDLGGALTARIEGRCSYCEDPPMFIGEFTRLAKTRVLRTGGHRRFTQYVRVALCERHSKKHRAEKP